MNVSTQTLPHETARESTFKRLSTGSMLESAEAIAVIALAIVGLAGVYSVALAAIATIVLGAAAMLERRAGMAGEFRITGETAVEAGASEDRSAEFLGGMAAIILGVLALLGLAPVTLPAVAVIVLGAAFLLSGTTFQGNGMTSVSNGKLLIGLCGVILGILAVIGQQSLTLTLVALLVLGAAALFNGSTRSSKTMMRVAQN